MCREIERSIKTTTLLVIDYLYRRLLPGFSAVNRSVPPFHTPLSTADKTRLLLAQERAITDLVILVVCKRVDVHPLLRCHRAGV